MTNGPAQLDQARSAGSRIAVIDKAVAVLDALASVPDGLTPTAVARMIDTNRSTAFRLLVSLEQTGLLSREAATGKYRLGMKLLQYGAVVRLGMRIVEVAEPVLLELRDETRQTTLLAVREQCSARCLLRLPGLEVDVLSWTTGQCLPLHVEAAPLALMSTLSAAELDRCLQEGERWQAGDLELTEARLGQCLDDVRRRGWARNAVPVTPGVTSLGTTVHDRTGAIVGAISVSGLQHHYEGPGLEPMAAKVLAAARDIGQQLP